ncbi:uncharacterized protein B0I36DRAFT_317436 [Microdochium trichocladiopsis]|uniref:DNA polymerase n=1 Tax=Microdochium trichocladiopsis TaxID=1682393 RepID=A0A9P8YAP1_9PEZI|nr:uncharacterized protein B0I36DRAFT_317436 [Microdochium trichocladiopsis]KAH7035018.1 hypothetical protein B0I36DRAFT_317436 [Microdochium trichocladiopsis]
MIVVNEDYPLHCISYRKLINPHQSQYVVRGAPTPDIIPATAVDAPAGEPSSSSAAAATQASSERSLKLKPKHNNPARWDYVPPDNTPPRSAETSVQGSSSQSRPENRSEVASSDQAEVQIATAASPPDDIEDITHVSETILPPEWTVLGQTPLAAGEEHDDGDELLSCIRDIRSATDEFSNMLNTVSDGELDEDTNSDSDANVTHEVEEQDASQTDDATRRTTRSTATPPSGMLAHRKGTWQDHFACMRAGVQGAASDNPNSRTIELLQKMLDHNEQVNDQWRTMSYKKAIAALKRHPVRITTAEQARGVVGIGQGISEKIEEIVRTDSLRKLEFVQNDPQFKVLQLFLKIYGVGIKQAQQWVTKGYQTLEDLVAHASLNAGQKIGIEHFDDLNTRIPRQEVAALGDFVMAMAAEIDPAVELIIGGSYRRGARSSGDIDFIVTKKGTRSTDVLVPFLHQLVEKLYEVGFLTATLSSLAAEVKQGHGSKWHGCCVLPQAAAEHYNGDPSNNDNDDKSKQGKPIWRRIDFLLVPDAELGAAMIYFTGDDIFNRSLRLLADKKGMRLNQRGLYKDVLRGPKRVKLTEGELIEGHDERKIFEILGVKWREPTERWCQ